jgi:hypothetical protein
MAALAAGALIAPAHAQQMQQVQTQQVPMQQGSGFNALDPQWAFASPFMSAGFGGGPNWASAINQQQVYTSKLKSGTLGLFVESSGGASGPSGNTFGVAPRSQDWFANLNPVSQTSMFGSYKSNPDTALSGLYTTASFGVTSLKMNPSGFSGLPGFTNGDAVAVTARAGVGLQLTPQISVEGSVGFSQTQGQLSPFR